MKVKDYLSLTIIVAGLCSIIYELLVSATATYFLGDGVKQFSILIGIYLFSMGVGAYFSKHFQQRPLPAFIMIEYLLGLIGGLSVPILYFLFVQVSATALQLYALIIIFVIGLLTGAEVPLLTFAFKDSEVKERLSLVLSLDYIGGLMATLLFPFILLPFVGLFYSSLLFGIVNVLLGIIITTFVLKLNRSYLWIGLAICIFLIAMVLGAGNLLKIWENKIYKHPVAFQEQTPYQKIVLTKNKHNDVRLFLNRTIQFSSLDEYRYHELLVHVPALKVPRLEHVLILGGGENLATREVLKYSEVKKITVVDIDPKIFELAKNNSVLLEINQNAANHAKVQLANHDAFRFLYDNHETYDLIICDLPDPTNESLARLYSKEFFLLVKQALKPDGAMVTQAGEIYFANKTFSCIYNTIASVFPETKAYHTYVPSFGDWGFVMAGASLGSSFSSDKSLPSGLKFLNPKFIQYNLEFPQDIQIVDTKINRLDKPVILNYFTSEWERWKAEFENSTSGL